MTRIVFLDFDGVLHPAAASSAGVLPFEWVGQLEALLGPYADVAVVVHSSWRERFGADELREFLGPLAHRFLGAVKAGPKAQAILDFVRAHAGIERWLVIEDSRSEFPEDFQGDVVICDSTRGIVDPAAQAAVRQWLCGPSPASQDRS